MIREVAQCSYVADQSWDMGFIWGVAVCFTIFVVAARVHSWFEGQS